MVAIIAILAAIAVPNFLEAQTRAKISRAKADMRTMATGIEAYAVDNNGYVYQNALSRAIRMSGVNTATLERLTTPISYLTGITGFRSPIRSSGWYKGANLDQFTAYNDGQRDLSQIYWYNARNNGNSSGDGAAIWGRNDPKPSWFFTHTPGPMGFAYATNDALNGMTANSAAEQQLASAIQYDPTNGTVSAGGIFRLGGSSTGMGQAFYRAAQANAK